MDTANDSSQHSCKDGRYHHNFEGKQPWIEHPDNGCNAPDKLGDGGIDRKSNNCGEGIIDALVLFDEASADAKTMNDACRHNTEKVASSVD
jgi:hypothetical protein